MQIFVPRRAQRDGDDKWWESEPLRRLDISNNSISSIPDDAREWLDLALLRVTRNAIREVSSAVFALPHLKLLDLSHNRLNRPPSIPTSAVAPIVELHLAHNELEMFPAGIEGESTRMNAVMCWKPPLPLPHACRHLNGAYRF